MSALPEHALAAGADLVISSTHKIVGSLTQSAMLHLGQAGGELIGEDTVDRAVTLTESTSPSALLGASLDAARRQAAVHGRELLEHTMTTLARAREQIRAIDGLDVLDDRLAGRPGVFAYDPLRLAVDVRGVAASGYELAPLLREIDDINLELYGQNVLVAVFGLGERGLGEAARLVMALERGDRPRRPRARRSRGQLRGAAAVGRARDDPARGLSGRSGGCAGGAGGGTRSRPSRLPPIRPAYRTCSPGSASPRRRSPTCSRRLSWAEACAAQATVCCTRSAWWPSAARLGLLQTRGPALGPVADRRERVEQALALSREPVAAFTALDDPRRLAARADAD